MSLSKIIKFQGIDDKKSDILTSRSLDDSPIVERFCSLDSLWQSSDTEYVDAVARVKELKETATRQSKEMVAQAQASVDEIEGAAFEKGLSAGKEQALAEEREQVRIRMEAFDQFLNGLESDRQELHQNYEQDIVTLIKTMVDRIVFHEVTVNPLVIQTCLKTAMSNVVANAKVKIHLHSADFNRLKEASLEQPDLLSGVQQVELTEDPTISEGGCFLETKFGDVDITLETRRDKLYNAIDQIFLKALAEQG